MRILLVEDERALAKEIQEFSNHLDRIITQQGQS